MQRITMCAGFQLAGIALAILRIVNRALLLFNAVLLRDRNICELFELGFVTKQVC